jgi:membrane protein DedA with SNARE-associated domain
MSLDALYWCASVFLWSLFTGIGIPPLPEEAGILYAAGLTTLHPEVTWWMAWPAASLGIVAADLVLYGIGRLWGRRVLEHRWVHRVLSQERRVFIEDRFHRHGMKFLLMARLLPPLRTGVFIIAGSIHYSLVRFLIADGIYGVVGVGLVFFGGTALMGLIHVLGNWLLFAGAVAVLAFGLHYYYRYLRKLEVRASEKVVEAVAPVIAPKETKEATGVGRDDRALSAGPLVGGENGRVGAGPAFEVPQTRFGQRPKPAGDPHIGLDLGGRPAADDHRADARQ